MRVEQARHFNVIGSRNPVVQTHVVVGKSKVKVELMQVRHVVPVRQVLQTGIQAAQV